MESPQVNQLMTVHTEKSVFGLIKKENKTLSEVKQRLGAAYLDVIKQEIIIRVAGIRVSRKSFITQYGEQNDKTVKSGIGFNLKS